MPRDFGGTLLKARWQDFELDAFEVPENVSGVEVLNYNIQVPLKREAIQLRLVGGSDRKDELLQLANDLLASLQGESNWLHSVAPVALANSPRYGLLVVAAVEPIQQGFNLWIVCKALWFRFDSAPPRDLLRFLCHSIRWWTFLAAYRCGPYASSQTPRGEASAGRITPSRRSKLPAHLSSYCHS